MIEGLAIFSLIQQILQFIEDFFRLLGIGLPLIG
jgi:hypothetical protein